LFKYCIQAQVESVPFGREADIQRCFNVLSREYAKNSAVHHKRPNSPYQYRVGPSDQPEKQQHGWREPIRHRTGVHLD